MESYFFSLWLKTCAISAGILIGTHPCLESSVNSISLMNLFTIFSVFWRSPESVALGTSANTIAAGQEQSWLPVDPISSSFPWPLKDPFYNIA